MYFLAGVANAQCAQRFADCGGVMPKVIDHSDASGNTADLHAALDSFECIEGGLDLRVLQPAMFCARDDCERVSDIEFPKQIDAEFRAGNFEFGNRGRELQVEAANAVLLG